MSTVYRLKASELDIDFLEKIKTRFGDSEIEIVVPEIDEIDETEYLFSSKANKKRLLEAVANLKARQNLVEVDLDDLL